MKIISAKTIIIFANVNKLKYSFKIDILRMAFAIVLRDILPNAESLSKFDEFVLFASTNRVEKHAGLLLNYNETILAA